PPTLGRGRRNRGLTIYETGRLVNPMTSASSRSHLGERIALSGFPREALDSSDAAERAASGLHRCHGCREPRDLKHVRDEADPSFRRRSDIASRRSQAKESGMNPRHGKLVALVSALTIGVAATATAGGGGVTGLAPGGRTLAGPAMARIEMQATDTI